MAVQFAIWQRSPMRTDLFDFELPEERIALEPASPRDAARLLVVGACEREPASLEDRCVADLPQLLCPGDALVLNDTRVLGAALCGRRRSEEHTSELQSRRDLVCRLLLEKK